jgi:hypothetical protein
MIWLHPDYNNILPSPDLAASSADALRPDLLCRRSIRLGGEMGSRSCVQAELATF